MMGGGANQTPSTVTVAMAEYQFAPETVMVKVGDVVGWSNGGTTSHTSTSDAALWNSNSMSPPGPPPETCPYPPCSGTGGGTFQFKFNTAGTYPYHCAFHQALGMKGVVIVSP